MRGIRIETIKALIACGVVAPFVFHALYLLCFREEFSIESYQIKGDLFWTDVHRLLLSTFWVWVVFTGMSLVGWVLYYRGIFNIGKYRAGFIAAIAVLFSFAAMLGWHIVVYTFIGGVK